MRKEFLEQLTKKFPNDQELGTAVRYYFKLINTEEFPFTVAEELVLAKNFQL
jgi:hypothetical protein